MSDVPPPVGSYEFVLQQVNNSEDELRSESAFRKNGENDIHTSQPRRLSLQFRNGLSLPILTGKEIKGNGCTSIKVALIDDLSGQVVESGPEAKATVEIVGLKGTMGESDNFTSEEFNSNIVAERKGTKSLLGGNVDLKLIKGIGVVDNVKFRHCSTWMSRAEFKLGARVKDTFSGVHIREAKTESFTVLDSRNEYNKKHDIPSLNDEAWRLKNIAKNRKIHKQLHEQNIDTVRDFLVLLFKDPEGLKHIVGLESKKWEATVENARKCKIDKRMTCYIDSSRDKAVVFNLVDQVLAVVSRCQYTPVDELSENDKEEARNLAVYALENRKDVLSFDDEASLLHYCSSCFEDMITSSINVADGSTTYSCSMNIDENYEMLHGQPSVEQDTSSGFAVETMFADFEENYEPSMEQDTFADFEEDYEPSAFAVETMFADFEEYYEPSVEQNTSSAFVVETMLADFEEDYEPSC